jgi:hypothetical protein
MPRHPSDSSDVDAPSEPLAPNSPPPDLCDNQVGAEHDLDTGVPTFQDEPDMEESEDLLGP